MTKDLPPASQGGIWSLSAAKARLSELIDRAQAAPQVIAVNGQQNVVVVSAKEWERRTSLKGTLAAFLFESPLRGANLDLKRCGDRPRDV
jgi:prevent-host-death family protein